MDVDKCRGELSERDKELLLMRRASGAQATQLEKMEKMLSETRGMLDKKTETGTEGKASEGDTMGRYQHSNFIHFHLFCVYVLVLLSFDYGSREQHIPF